MTHAAPQVKTGGDFSESENTVGYLRQLLAIRFRLLMELANSKRSPLRADGG